MMESNATFESVDYDPFGGDAVQAVVPATEAQLEIWASVRMGGDDANRAFNESVSVRVHGPVNHDALVTAMRAMMQRHESLRGVFSGDGRSLCILTEMPLEIPLVDLSACEPEARDEQLGALLDADVETPFDLQRGPLVRVQLVKLAPNDHQVVLTAHHIVCDGWAIDVLVRDLGLSYAAALAGGPCEMPEADRFTDYALALAEYARSEKARADEAFWLSRFDRPVESLELPLDRPRPTLRSFRGARVDHGIDAALMQELKQLGTASGATVVNVMLAAFTVLIHRLSGQSDLVIGLPSAGQSAMGKASLVGHCVNLLPLRTCLSADEPFPAYVSRVRETLLDAYEHQPFTFGRLVQCLRMTRDPGRIPVLPVAFNIDQGISLESFEFGGVQTEFYSNPRHYENFEIFLNVMPQGGGYAMQCYFNADLFDRATIEAWMRSFEALLRGLCADPAQTVGACSLLTESERTAVLAMGAGARPEYPRARSVHDLFSEQARSTPEAVAAECVAPDGTHSRLTYGELDARSDELAARLQAAGVAAGEHVGLCTERSADVLVGVLGILKAGGVYVPLDPAYPAERLTFMMTDTQMTRRVVSAGTDGKLPAFDGATLEIGDASPLPESWSAVACDGESAAYVMYTSGSTGRPKGARIPHRGITRLVCGTDYVSLDRDTVMLQFAPISFDASTLEIWGALLNGGRLVICPPGMLSPEQLGAVIRERAVNTAWLTAELFRVMVDERLDDLKGVRQLLAGGDVLPVPQVERVLEALPDCRLINGYGPTENTTFTCCYDVTAGCRVSPSVPIGRPIANTTAYVLDARGEPVPPGVSGELFTGGDGVALGYLERPELTGAVFVPDPFEAGRLMYRTGDRVRWLPDGNLEFLGRMDRQLKIRGFRVEPGEIESAVAAHDAVKQAAVTVRRAGEGDHRLVAYYVSAEGAVVPWMELRKRLRSTLPDYMVPQHFVEMDALPMTPSGKIDRQALPDPESSGPERTVDPPQTEMETRLADLWCELLGTERVGRHDNFFDLGGHSLLAIRMVGRIKEQTGSDLPPNAVLFNTLEQLAAQLGAPLPDPGGVESGTQPVGLAGRLRSRLFGER